MPGVGPPRRRAVPSSRVVAGAVVLAVALTAIVGVAELLRYPGGQRVPGAGITDPRDEVDCPQPDPREGRERPEAVVGPPEAPVEVSSAVLLECPGTFDGSRVRYEGEVVGGLLPRERGTWTLLNDDAYGDALGPLPTHQVFLGSNAGIGVLLPADLADEVSRVGGPGVRGDFVAVTGTFHRVDDASGEVTVVEAHTGEILRPGEPVTEPVLPDRRAAAALLAVVAAVVVGVERWVNRA